MLFFFDALLGADRVYDPEGAEFSDQSEAIREAGKITVELIVEELRQGKRVGADWRVDVLDSSRNSVASVLFFDVLFDPEESIHAVRMLRRHLLGEVDTWPPYQRSQAVLEETHEIAANVRAVFREMKQQLDAIT